MNGEAWLKVFHNPQLHDYIMDFTRGNISESRKVEFYNDVWCDIGMLAHSEPSLHCIAEVVWRKMIQYEPILAKLADGYTQREVARMECVSQPAITKRKKRITRGYQNSH